MPVREESDAATIESKMAVAFLAKNVEESPEAVRPIVDRLVKYGTSLDECSKVIKMAQDTINDMQSIAERTLGAIDATTSIAAGMLNEDQVRVFSIKFKESDSGKAYLSESKKRAEVDMAGQTAKQMPPPKLPS